ncbi:hypothetical protein [Photobacterium leiognathi]|uniref:hypothetical protein n=1 Tax=Photobacterium leiognathi TaxID=553611 RepID=UPI00020880D2|nr:hypothetical protein [Photobacterium leiognathi]PSW48331.1 hypothetical protein CTM83_20065 [Photobacterium leiognathi subsp. mandapamensis]GAA03234.1 putative phage tail fibre protein [Photobacterium leiognathi subsp. mandapamensis svers.1.1.]
MAVLPEKDEWVEGIYQLEETDPVQGGVDGIDNLQAQQLAARTRWLKNRFVDKGQLLPWSATRTYTTGELCTVLIDGVMTIMEMYSPPDRVCLNKDPSDPKNRQVGWDDATQPFWWVPYKANQAGMPFYWLAETAPEGSVMEIGANLPVAVYWRLAREYPHLVNNGMINTGDIRAEFIRVWDGGRGIDNERQLNTWQRHAVEHHNHLLPTGASQSDTRLFWGIGDEYWGTTDHFNATPVTNEYAITESYGRTVNGIVSGNFAPETRSRNIARAMAIYI